MTNITSYLKQDPLVKEEINEMLIKYNSTNLKNQSEAGKTYLTQNIIYAKAVQVMGDEIYELENENEVLKEELGKVGVYDPKIVKELTKLKSLSDTDEIKNKKIYSRLVRRLQRNNKLTQ